MDLTLSESESSSINETAYLSVSTFNIEGLTLTHYYSTNPDLKSLIEYKSVVLKKYLGKIKSDIFCLQEYVGVLKIKLDGYDSIVSGSNMILYKREFKCLKHYSDNEMGLIIDLDLGEKFGGYQIQIMTNRLPPLSAGKEIRIETMKKIDSYAKDKSFIFAGDTNMRKMENQELLNLSDSIDTATFTNGYFTIDKVKNPYFANDEKLENKSRYDRIYHTDLLYCNSLGVYTFIQDEGLKHPLYPFGGLSDHFLLEAIFEL